MSDPICDIHLIFMKPAKSTKKKVAKAPAKAKEINVNLDYVTEIADGAVATIMALRGLVAMLVAEKEARK